MGPVDDNEERTCQPEMFPDIEQAGHIDRPKSGPASREFRFLKVEEVEALLRAVPEDAVGPTDRELYLTAAMTGFREDELVALRWKDVDWAAGVIRLRVNYTHGRWGTPKSGHGRAVPLADRVAAELERHYQRSSYRKDDAQVFGHPHTGRPYDASTLLRRFKSVCQRAGVREVRFHDLRHTSPHRWRRPACRCEQCRRGLAMPATRRQRSTPTTPATCRAAGYGRRGRSRPCPSISPSI